MTTMIPLENQEVIQKNSNILINKGNKMQNNETTDISQDLKHDLNLDNAENVLKNIIDRGENYPTGSIVNDLADFGYSLTVELECLEYLADNTIYFNHIEEFITAYTIPKIKELKTKVFSLSIEHMATDNDIWICRHTVVNESSMQAEQYILLLEKVLKIKPDTHYLNFILNDPYQYKYPLTHSDAERISSILNYPMPACREDFSLLPEKR